MSLPLLLWNTAIILFMIFCIQLPHRLPMMQDKKSLTHRWLWCSGWGREHVSLVYSHKGGRFIWKEYWHTNQNSLWLALRYLNTTINTKPETQNWRLEPMGLAKPGETCRLTGTGPGLAREDADGRVFERFWNRTEPFLQSEPGLLEGYPDLLLTLTPNSKLCSHIIVVCHCSSSRTLQWCRWVVISGECTLHVRYTQTKSDNHISQNGLRRVMWGCKPIAVMSSMQMRYAFRDARDVEIERVITHFAKMRRRMREILREL